LPILAAAIAAAIIYKHAVGTPDAGAVYSDDYVPRTCSGMERDTPNHVACEFAMANGAPVGQTFSVLFYASVENSAIVCNFSLSEIFLERKAELLALPKMRDVYAQSILFLSEDGRIPDKSAMCKHYYFSFSPGNTKHNPVLLK
jgi:hypothetical protein